MASAARIAALWVSTIGQRIAHPLERRVEIGRDLAGVLRRQLGADGELLAADDDPDGVLGRCSCRGASAVLLEEREAGREHAEPLLGRLDPLPQRLVLGLQLDDPLPRLLELGPGHHAAAGRAPRSTRPPLAGVRRRQPASSSVRWRSTCSSSSSALRSGRS